MTDKKELLKSIDRNLEMILKLEVEDKIDEFDTKKEKIKILHGTGFNKDEIADFVDSTRGSVRATLNDLEKEGEIND